MTDHERYLFDLRGFLVVEGCDFRFFIADFLI